MNILFGHYVADEGAIAVAGPDGACRPLPPGSPHAALEAGIGMVHQHFALAESLTRARERRARHRGLVLAASSASARRAKRLKALMTRERPRRAARPPRLAALGRRAQRVEILKVLYRGARILVLDEPTAVLTPQEADGLFVVLRRSPRAGSPIIFISHKLREVLAIADRVAVLRAGRKVAETSAAATDRRAPRRPHGRPRGARKAAASRGRRAPRC